MPLLHYMYISKLYLSEVTGEKIKELSEIGPFEYLFGCFACLWICVNKEKLVILENWTPGITIIYVYHYYIIEILDNEIYLWYTVETMWILTGDACISTRTLC